MPDEMEDAAEQQMIDCKCPYCGETVSFPEMDAGTIQECPFCLQILIVPQQNNEQADKFPLPIMTERLVLRRMNEEDADAVAQMMADEKLLKYTGYSTTDEMRVFNWLKTDSKEPLTIRDNFFWLGIALNDVEKLIGLANVYFFDQTRRQLQMMVFISKDEQRKGYGEESIRGLLEFSFNGINMRRVAAFCDSRDEAFMKLAAKVGLRQEGASFEDRYVKGEWVNTAYYAMLQSEYQNAGQ